MQKGLVVNFLFIVFLLTFTHQHLANERIFDGSEAPPHAYPWMVSIRLNIFNMIKRNCGGVILSDEFILTAASCFENVTLFTRFFIIQAGVHTIGFIREPTEQIRSIAELIPHPNYMADFYLNDLAFIRVSPPFYLDKLNVFPIVLSNLTSVENMDLTAIGWGEINFGIISTPLRQTIVQENVKCTQNKLPNPITQLCASGTCLGDTGGPLMIYSNETQQYELVGITSFRDKCTTEGVFTRIAPYIDLILTILKKPPPSPTPQPTFPTLSPTVSITTSQETTGPAIPFVCNTNYSCGCSPIPVVFHDEYSIRSKQYSTELEIVGGETAQEHSWPWAVLLRTPPSHSCSGSIIHSEWIVTAAHCSPSTLTMVHIGVHDERLPPPEIRQVVEVIIHPDYIPAPKFLNDIALLRISPPINFTISQPYASPSCLPPKEVDINYPKVNTRLAVIGWGRLSEGGPRPNILHQVRVKALANNDWRCVNTIFDSDRQFCAMVDGGGKDACQGDSGGPIHQWLDDYWEQVGIVSFGEGCASANHPGVYTRLSFYYDWIQSNLNEINQTTETTVVPPTTNATDVNTTVSNTAIVYKTKVFFYVIIYVGLQFFKIF